MNIRLNIERLIMRILNFTANPKDGIIKIPKALLKDLKDEVYVIIVLDKEEQQLKKRKKHLTAFSAKTKGLIINREEANVRKKFS
jgi:hypothetical protein